jgi:hypothetical protein
MLLTGVGSWLNKCELAEYRNSASASHAGRPVGCCTVTSASIRPATATASRRRVSCLTPASRRATRAPPRVALLGLPSVKLGECVIHGARTAIEVLALGFLSNLRQNFIDEFIAIRVGESPR